MVLVWEPIKDLPNDWRALSDGELGPLLVFWKDQRADLEQSGALAEFSARLAREWAIETGQIEGVYNLDRGVTETLIERGINADLIPNQPGQKLPELIAAIIQDHADVLEGLFQFVKGERPISKGYIHELHAALLAHQETTLAVDPSGNYFESRLLKGKYKEHPNNPRKPGGTMHQYCPPEQVDSEMERMLAMHHDHEKRGVPVEVGAAWLHHRFTQIHPYQDGNGRVARALASLLFIKAGWFPIVVTRDNHAGYIDALEMADGGGLESLVLFFTHIEKRELSRAMKAIPDIRPVKTVDDAIAAVKRVLDVDGHSEPVVWIKANDISERLSDFAKKRLHLLAKSLGGELAETRKDLVFAVGQDHEGTIFFKINARQRGVIKEQARFSVIARAPVSGFRGLIQIAVAFDHSHSREPASKEPFQTNYAETYEDAERRFTPWLEESLVNALVLWRKTL